MIRSLLVVLIGLLLISVAHAIVVRQDTDGTAASLIELPNFHTMTGAASISSASCGTGGALVAGSTDGSGTVTLGSGAITACKIAFSQTFAARPRCFLAAAGLTVVLPVTVTTTDFTVNAVATGGTSIDWQCVP